MKVSVSDPENHVIHHEALRSRAQGDPEVLGGCRWPPAQISTRVIDAVSIFIRSAYWMKKRTVNARVALLRRVIQLHLHWGRWWIAKAELVAACSSTEVQFSYLCERGEIRNTPLKKFLFCFREKFAISMYKRVMGNNANSLKKSELPCWCFASCNWFLIVDEA